MKAIILAAGRGSRMKKMTESKPKCLLELGGKTLLQWQTEALHFAGISSIAIVRGYRRNSLQQSGYQYFDNTRWAETNMVVSLSCAKSLLESHTCLIAYSDIVYHPSIIVSLINSTADIAITYDQKWESLWMERFENPLKDAETFESHDGKLKSIGGKSPTLSTVRGQYMGLIKLTPNGWKQIDRFLFSLLPQKLNTMDMTSLLKGLLVRKIPIATVPIKGKWCEVDREKDLSLYERKIHQYKNWSHDWRRKWQF